MEELIKELEREVENALWVEKANRQSGSPPQGSAYDSGRYTGLKDALEIVLKHYDAKNRRKANPDV